MPLPPAHLGHWWGYILYAVPLAVVIGAIVLTKAQDRRAEREQGEAGGEPPERGDGAGEDGPS